MTTQQYKEKLVNSIDNMILKYNLKSKYNLLYKSGTHDIEYLEEYSKCVEKYAINNRVTIIEYPITNTSLVKVLPKNVNTLEEGINYLKDDGFHLLKKNSKYYIFNGDNNHVIKT